VARPVVPADVEVAGIRISRPDRPVFAELGIAKIDLARYFEAVAPRMVGHVGGRPLTLVWCPEGVAGGCRFMRHQRVWGPSALRRVSIAERTKIGEYLVADDTAGLVALAQMGVVEVHTWNTRAERVELPDRLVIDLDPGPAVAWPTVVGAAHQVRRALGAVGLDSWVKTTGGAGLHVVAPLVPGRDTVACLAFARGFARFLAREQPDVFTTGLSRRGRDDRILVDYLRNNRTNTSVAAFSPRARPEATVSMPVAWDELTPRLRPARFTVKTAPRRLREPDPWAAYVRCEQVISDRAFAALADPG
jgi:bifunctional non-homologous end joining protein LigD